MNDIADELFKLFGISALLVLMAYLIFQFLGRKWIENKFSERLEQFKYKQEQEIQRMRVEIDSTLSRVLQMQDKEFETLTETWSKLEEAVSWTENLVSPIQSVPDLDRLTEAELEEFLAETELRPTQKEKIRNAVQKWRVYREITSPRHILEVKKYIQDYRICVARYGIFFTDDMHEKLTEIGKKLQAIVTNFKIGSEVEDFAMMGNAREEFNKDVEPLVHEIELLIRKRLRPYSISEN